VRPVNLIPAEDRPGSQRPLRTGPLAYIIVGALAVALLGVTALVVTSSQISDREAEVTRLESEQASAQAQAQSLAAYTQFHSIREQRVATIAALADSRFDWARVMHELSLVLPSDVWLSGLTGSARPGADVGGGSSISLREAIAGPALELVGCATSQRAVAGFVQALKDIDGVTRVGVQGSSLSGAGESSSASTCETSGSTAQFQMVVAFDAAPVPPAALSGEATAPVEAATVSETSSEEGEG
jgi:Tfp pilus assembly protein PilN